MKKLYIFLFLFTSAVSAMAQTAPNAGMEAWRTGTSGTAPVVSIMAPQQWYGFDTLAIALGQAFGSFIGAGSDWHAQLFQETTIKNTGSSSAKLVTLKQDTLGLFAGMLSSSEVSVDMGAILAGANPMDALTFTGGIPVTLRIQTVSAWVIYHPGKDSITGIFGGADTAILTVQAIGTIGGYDSVIGAGFVAIPPCSTFTQITAPIIYTDTSMLTTDKIRIVFASSGGASQNLDSSILYVDDVTMTGNPQVSHVGVAGVKNSSTGVYPNPANNVLFLQGLANEELAYSIVGASGQVALTGNTTGNEAVDISSLAPGLYIYSITGSKGTALHGKVTVVR
ncbi:MAG: T9SS type A sorting domain-containing protein [Bacteroidota bacterium]